MFCNWVKVAQRSTLWRHDVDRRWLICALSGGSLAQRTPSNCVALSNVSMEIDINR